jgi:hypothetical protein
MPMSGQLTRVRFMSAGCPCRTLYQPIRDNRRRAFPRTVVDPVRLPRITIRRKPQLPALLADGNGGALHGVHGSDFTPRVESPGERGAGAPPVPERPAPQSPPLLKRPRARKGRTQRLELGLRRGLSPRGSIGRAMSCHRRCSCRRCRADRHRWRRRRSCSSFWGRS